MYIRKHTTEWERNDGARKSLDINSRGKFYEEHYIMLKHLPWINFNQNRKILTLHYVHLVDTTWSRLKSTALWQINIMYLLINCTGKNTKPLMWYSWKIYNLHLRMRKSSWFCCKLKASVKNKVFNRSVLKAKNI